MGQARTHSDAPASAQVLDFDAALLSACPTGLREDLMAEAALLANALAPEGRAEHLRAMAAALPLAADDEPVDRARARRLAAALRRLAQDLEG
ncbi:MAG: hypothetical protein ACJ798_15495 [Phenylobacterium sp.]